MIPPLSLVAPDTHALPALYFPLRHKRDHAKDGAEVAAEQSARLSDSVVLSPAATRILEQQKRLKEMSL